MLDPRRVTSLLACVTRWDDLARRLAAGARVAVVGPEPGRAAIPLAHAFPTTSICGFGRDGRAVAAARLAAAATGVSARVTFEIGAPDDFAGFGYDLVCLLDSAPAAGSPQEAARHACRALADGGVLLLVGGRAVPMLCRRTARTSSVACDAGPGDVVATPKVERLVNLTVALLETRRPLTFAEIRRRTGFYEQSDAESARRMFERDKDDLRRLGVPVEVREVAFGEDHGYQVPRDAYELPDVELTAQEVAALALAIRVTGTPLTPLAYTKLVARAPDPSGLDTQPTTRVALSPDAVDPVADAVVDRAPLAFTYRTAAGEVSTRTIDPYGVVRRRAAWYLVGRDHHRDALRAFRLDRIVDRPRVVGPGGGFERPDDLDVAAAVSGPEVASAPATLAVEPTARWAVELRGGVPTGETRGDRIVMQVDDVDPVRDLPWLLGFGPDVIVLDPPELRETVVAALRRVLTPTSGG